MNRPLILASDSPRRKDLLRQIGVDFLSVSTHVDEAIVPGETPEMYVCRVALDKARAAARHNHDAVIIAADTIVVLDGIILGKPADSSDATRMLNMLSGRVHRVLTGIALVDSGKERALTKFETTKVWFQQLVQNEISSYVATGEPLDKAGAYGIQERGALFVEKIEGCYFNVVGLPIHLLGTMLKSFGINLFSSK